MLSSGIIVLYLSYCTVSTVFDSRVDRFFAYPHRLASRMDDASHKLSIPAAAQTGIILSHPMTVKSQFGTVR
jgi:hypothetical protein